MSVSRVTANVDFEKSGIQHGYLRVPYSTDRSAYGRIPIPITVAARGAGPTVLLTAGIHGDECEGPVALMRLIRSLSLNELNGRIIIIPALNFPAWLRGTRTSPLDSLNLNRSFPGDRDGMPTEMIAHYVESVLLPLADYCFDFHSGGSSLRYIPSLIAHGAHTEERRQLIDELVRAFAPPRILYMDMLGEDRIIAAAAERHDVCFLTGEFGGGGTLDPDGVGILSVGLLRMLHSLGILPGERIPRQDMGPNCIHSLLVRGEADYIFAEREGIFEPLFRLGDTIRHGQLAGYIHDSHHPWNEPATVHFANEGIAVCIRNQSHVIPGDCLGHIAGNA